jgi:transposase
VTNNSPSNAPATAASNPDSNAVADPVRPDLFVGVDVSKQFLDCARSDQRDSWRVNNDPAGIESLVQTLLKSPPACIVVESTGGFERNLAGALLDAGLKVAVVNPKFVRHFAIGLGIKAKTDALDASVLARFAQVAGPRLLERTPDKEAELDALVTCRRQLVKSKTEQTNRLGTTDSKAARKALTKVVNTLQREIDKLEKRIREHIDSDDQWKRLDEIIQSAPGAGGVLAATLVSQLPELGKADHRQISALVGVAPFNCDSGKKKGKRCIQGGRECVRSVLFMATVAAMHSNPVIRPFAERLEKAGKIWKVRVTACMRKFLILLNTMVREKLTWNELNLVKNLQKNP